VGRGDRIPGLPGDDHRVQVPQDRGGDDGLRLGSCELVLFAAGCSPSFRLSMKATL
jgi:hypothetical protein